MIDEHKQQTPEDDSALSRLYRSSRREEPDSELDERILAQVRTLARRRRRRWLLPVSSVAVMLLGLTLTLQLTRPPELPSLESQPEAPESVFELVAPAMEKKMPAPARPQALDRTPSAPAMSTSRQSPQTPASGQTRERMEQEWSADTQDASGSPDVDLEADAQRRLKEIEKLLDRGDSAAAIQALETLRARYPDFPLPARLKGLVRDQSR